MDKITLIATATFGLEAVVKNELRNMGFDKLTVSDGKVEFEADLTDIPKTNLWLRSADRVLLKMGEFDATTFDELFEQTKALPWEDWITADGEFTVKGKSIKSQLGSVPACQSIVKKAVVEKLKARYKIDWFEETGPKYTIQVALLKDRAVLTLDTSGSGLHKRGYRTENVEAPLKETLAAALVQLTFWNKKRILIDPMCGSGTLLIEAALIAKNIAPGINRSFVSEDWPALPKNSWLLARQVAQEAVCSDTPLQLFGSDINQGCIRASMINAKNAGVGDDITFELKDVNDLWIDKEFGVIITNPPYGIRVSEFSDINKIYVSFHKMLKKKHGWSLYLLTADEKFPDYFKRSRPSRVRKLYNGTIKVDYYQYYGDRPPRN